jgi:8-oxo-dGTP pyrophosphatase MutT (NUDIX family)
LGTVTSEKPTLRRAARVLLFDEDRRVLLVRFRYQGRSWWAAPGGGLEGDETHEEAARREVAEETSFELKELGPWIREEVFRFEGQLYRQLERYFVANVPAFDPRPKVIGAEEAKSFDGLRWWTPRELQATSENFAPADLPVLMERLVAQGPPDSPLEVAAGWPRH